MSKRLPFPIFMILIIIYFILLTKIPAYVSNLTKLPGWSLLLPHILLFIYILEKISKFAPQKIEQFILNKGKLTEDRQVNWNNALAISIISILEGIFLRSIEGFVTIFLMILNLSILIALHSITSPKQENEVKND